jgi:hypothetical protein
MARRHRLDLPTALHLLRAAWELALARRQLGQVDARTLTSNGNAAACQQDLDRIAFAIRAMGARVPWRSDCLVQALAAQHWLATVGVGSTIHLGVKASDEPLDAHAWLKVGERVVLGGDIADYGEFPLHEER